jgi:hypothetical protein
MVNCTRSFFLNGSNDKCIIRIRDSELGAVREFDSTFGTPVEINLDELRTLHPNTFRHSWIGCFDRRNPDKFCAGEVILLFEYAEMKAKVEERLLKLCRGKTTEFQSFIKVKIKAQHSSEESYNNYMIVKNNSVLADSIEKGEFRLAKPTNQMYSPGVHENYIHLELDDNPVRILYKVPENYTLKRKYPAFISLSTVNEGNYSWHDFENDINEDFSALMFPVKG